jgi:hypothetical protein
VIVSSGKYSNNEGMFYVVVGKLKNKKAAEGVLASAA